MRHEQTGFGGLHLLLVIATVAAASLFTVPMHEAPGHKAKIAEALNIAGESKHRISRNFMDSRTLPRTARQAQSMASSLHAKPDFVRDMRIQYDRDGNNVMIMVYLRDGVVDNILGGEQYVYIAGTRQGDGERALKWQCGARNIDLMLLPADCRGS